MRRLTTRSLVLAPALIVGCASHRSTTPQGTLAELRDVRPDLEEVTVEQGLDQAMQGYRRFLEETPETAMTPEAMRRLADLQLEKSVRPTRRRRQAARDGCPGAPAAAPPPPRRPGEPAESDRISRSDDRGTDC